MSEKNIKVSFPDGVEFVTITKNDYDRLCGELTYKNIILQQKVEQLENIRKEAIEYIKNNLTTGSVLDGKKIYCLNSYSFDYDDLLNILNKGSEE